MKRRVLLIDDEPDFTRLLRLSLESLGRYDVGEVNDPHAALAAARAFAPDVILLDVSMPGTDGGGLAAAFNNDAVLARVPVLFLTALVSARGGPARLAGSGATDLGGARITYPVLAMGRIE